MKRRIFIAINLPEGVKKRLSDFHEKWGGLFVGQSLGGGGPVRWTKKDSLHLTLVFIGYVSDDEMFSVCKLIREVAQKHEPVDLEFEKILYGPFGKVPRMIWLKGKPNKDVVELKADLENALASLQQLGSFKAETRPFSPHITLARIKTGQWNDMGELPQIEQDFKAVVPVESIEVMESYLKSDGAEYIILESCPLGK